VHVRERPNLRTARFVLVVSLLSLVACGGYIGRAKRDYNQGRYLEAAEQLGEHEEELGDLPNRKQAEYGIYRGLSLLQLGDYASATRWLSFAYTVEQANPGTLKPEQRALLDRGLLQLNQAVQLSPGNVVVPTAPSAVAPEPEPSP
jgi:hypothetical protein